MVNFILFPLAGKMVKIIFSLTLEIRGRMDRKGRRHRGDTATRSTTGLRRFMQENEKTEPVAYGKQIRIFRFWYARLDSNQWPTESESVTLSN